MIAAFLPPYAFRGQPAPYLWVFYRLLHSIGERMAFLLSADYLDSRASLEVQGRSELDLARQRALGYVTPDAVDLERHEFRLMDGSLMARLLPQYRGNPLAFFRAFLEDEIPLLRAEIETQLRSLPEMPEVVLAWSNCPSLSAAAAACGTRVAYMEMGPLRNPLYRSTAYFDFSGVNGNTEAEARYAAMPADALPANLTIETIRRSMSIQDVDSEPNRSHGSVGVVLQVEDDSNLLSYSNGFDNTALIARALWENGSGDILVRTHPGSRFALADPTLVVDASPNSAVFVQRCARVVTINSSVGLEALMYGVPVDAMGDSSYAFITKAPDADERLRRLAFYVFAYLVPFDEVFTADYIRFRLAGPSEGAIMARHVAAYSDTAYAANGEEAVRAFVNNVDVVGTLVDRHRQAGLAPGLLTKLYYRSEGELFSEERTVACMPLRDGSSHVARFKLPPGVRPAAVRFDPADGNGIYVFTELCWGSVAANETLPDHHPLIRLYDLGGRVVACGDRLYSDPGKVPVKVIASGDDPFLELAVGDLFGDVEGAQCSAALEVRFHSGDGEKESMLGYADVRDRLARLEEKFADGDFSGMYGALAQMQADLKTLSDSITSDCTTLERMREDMSEIVGSLKQRRRFRPW